MGQATKLVHETRVDHSASEIRGVSNRLVLCQRGKARNHAVSNQSGPNVLQRFMGFMSHAFFAT